MSAPGQLKRPYPDPDASDNPAMKKRSYAEPNDEWHGIETEEFDGGTGHQLAGLNEDGRQRKRYVDVLAIQLFLTTKF